MTAGSEPETLESLRAERDDLRRRIDEMEKSASSGRTPLTILTSQVLSIVEDASDCIGAFDLQGRSFFLNRSGRRLLGIGDGELPDKIETLHPEWAFKLVKEIGIPTAMREGVWRGESAVFDSRGKAVLVSQAIAVHKGPDGTPEFLSTIIRDLSWRSQVDRERNRFFALSPDMLCIAGFDGYFKHLNPAWERTLGYSTAELLEQPFLSLIHPDDVQSTIEVAGGLMKGKEVVSFENRYRCKDGTYRWLQWGAIADMEEQQTFNIARDITEKNRAEAEQRAAENTIRAQAAALMEMSTPLIPISEDILVMPLIGVLDSRRVSQVMDTLLSGIAKSRARVAILDVTGVGVVDTHVANALLRAARAVELLGASVVLTGIRPEVAQTLVGLGTELTGIVTRGTLQAGIAYALG